MEWEVLLDDDFAAWLDGLDAALRNEILAHAALLRERGPHLGRPYVDTLEGSAFTNMKELRIQFHGDPWRVLFALRLAENNLSVCGYFSAVFSSQHLSLSGQYFGAGLCGHIV